ncbi:MAG: GAF domain-containing protein [Desulfarculaceae bacterium]|nr:GAF domain-containing protein [Desulfarculaceae bacterium]MCF8073614.1 GAF domain-containing protein [Desulfarculaceae bacterium]MCF8103154.1 GAF domain-containing protein [Desulfarculaceae bacterium]MCF8115670.1 GAF domain-containing protein [Desulfarculaceae bacterium]
MPPSSPIGTSPPLSLPKELELKTREFDALAKGARAVLEWQGFAKAARSIFDYCKDLIGATSGYVALLSEDGAENELLFLEAGGLPCTVDPELPMPIRGLRAEAYRDGAAVYDNDFMNGPWVKFMPSGHVVLENVLFAPLNLESRTVGIMGLANKAGGFTGRDAMMATHFGELAAIALRNSQALEQRDRYAQEQERLIAELRKTLKEVKTLKGLLPICSICKRVRDDQGYWARLEEYLSLHADAEVSHGLCPTCMEEHYPEVCAELRAKEAAEKDHPKSR